MKRSNKKVIQYIVTMDRGHTQSLGDLVREIAYYIPRAHRARIRRLAHALNVSFNHSEDWHDLRAHNKWLQSPTNDFEFRWFNEMRPRRRIYKKRW